MLSLFEDGYHVVLLCDGRELARIERGPNPFREIVEWHAAGVAAVGAGAEVLLVELNGTRVLRRVGVGSRGDGFGHFGWTTDSSRMWRKCDH